MDETGNLVAAAAAATNAPTVDSLGNSELVQTAIEADSIKKTLVDSLTHMNVDDFKAVVTGENTLIKDALSSLLDISVAFVPKMIGAIAVLWIGWKLIKLLKKTLTKLLEKRGAEPTLKGFLTSLVDVLMKVMLVIMVMDIIGIKATSFIAILGAAGLAIGMALQGTLQNFAGGVILLLMRPFKAGDYIECGNYKGYVKEIRIFHTLIRPFNGRIIIVPNSELATKSLINHTKEPVIRLDVVASVAYGTDLDFARKVIEEVINSDPLVKRDPAPSICVSDLNNSSVDWSIWVWASVDDYWTIWKRIRENLYKAFNEYGIGIPYPQMDVHINPEAVTPKKAAPLQKNDDPIAPLMDNIGSDE
ncbi:MAG: mechanosensitive ion channel [Bacteroidales bacterium]|nr:mechanosensitive ion channel [Bacteroidales bacterium]